MVNYSALTFGIGVCYSVVSLAVAGACLGYENDIENGGFGYRAVIKGTALLSTVTFLASLGLLYGVMESRTGFITAWLVLQVVVPMYSSIFYIWAIFASGDETVFGPERTSMPICALLAGILLIVLTVCALIVNNFCSLLKGAQLRGTFMKNEMLE